MPVYIFYDVAGFIVRMEKGVPEYTGTPEKSYLHLNSVGSSIRDET